MIRHECEPGSEEWRRLRLGIPSASQASRIITPKGKPSLSRTKYMHELVAERLLDDWLGDDAGQFAARGTEMEIEAVRLYEMLTDTDTEPGGWCLTDDGRAGCSPDRLIMGAKRGVEVKCPKPSTHVAYMLSDGHGDDYGLQIQWSLWVTGFDSWDLISYHPELPHAMLRVGRNEPLIKLINDRAAEFCDELETMHEKARNLA